MNAFMLLATGGEALWWIGLPAGVVGLVLVVRASRSPDRGKARIISTVGMLLLLLAVGLSPIVQRIALQIFHGIFG